jgi:hypothetical protein
MEYVPKLSQSLWSVVQLVLLPLWAMCAAAIAHGFEIDVDIQLVFLAAFVLGVVDVFMDRLLTVIYACEVLDEGMLQGVQHVIVFFCIFVQTFLVVIINFVSGWRYTLDRGAPTMLSSDVAVDSTGLRTLNTWALVSFNVYYGLQALIKIWKLWFRSSEKSWMVERKKKIAVMGREWFSFKSIDEVQLAILLLFVFFYVLAVTITTNTTKNWFMAAWNSHGHPTMGMDIEDIQVMKWKADWMLAQGVHVM